jgi:ribosomal protein L24
MRISKLKVKKNLEKLDVNMEILSIDDVIEGIKVEMEHGKRSKKTNITDNNLIKTLKISLAHFDECGTNYYIELKKMEKKLKKKWKNQSIFL